jgi:enediyne biosynthesis protein E4
MEQLGILAAMIPAGTIASQFALKESVAQAGPPLNPLSPGTAERAAGPGFNLLDVASRAGLDGALNVFGGIHSYKYLLEEMGCGVAFFDYDHDGWIDIFFVNGSRFEGLPPGPPPSNFLFHNNRDGTFTNVTEKAGLVRSGWGQGCCVGDYDNDGFDDLFVSYWGQNVLYHNNGDGTFTDVTEKAGLIQKAPHPRWNTGCCFLDYDRDGHLDLFIADYVNFDPRLAPLPGANKLCTYFGMPVACGPQGMGGGTNILYRNRGNGTFEDVSEAAGVTNPRGLIDFTSVGDHWIPVGSYGMSAVAADFDNDGWPDIYVSCDEAPSLLYHNNHDGTFTEAGVAAGCALNEGGVTQGGMGIAVGDYDCDGWLDIVKPNFSGETISVYHNNGNGTFYDAVFQAGLGQSTNSVGWGAGLADFDNDGWRDIFISTGHVYPEIAGRNLRMSFLEPKILYKNLGNGHFENISAKAGTGATKPQASRGCAFGDFDNDGDVDIIVINMNAPPSLLRNDCAKRNNWIKVKCIGTKSNRSAIGARVRVVTGKHAQIDEVMSGSSYISQNDFRLHFGLGRAAKVDQITVRWPAGAEESFSNVEANQLVTIQEGHGIIKTEKFKPGKSS